MLTARRLPRGASLTRLYKEGGGPGLFSSEGEQSSGGNVASRDRRAGRKDDADVFFVGGLVMDSTASGRGRVDRVVEVQPMRVVGAALSGSPSPSNPGSAACGQKYAPNAGHLVAKGEPPRTMVEGAALPIEGRFERSVVLVFVRPCRPRGRGKTFLRGWSSVKKIRKTKMVTLFA